MASEVTCSSSSSSSIICFCSSSWASSRRLAFSKSATYSSDSEIYDMIHAETSEKSCFISLVCQTVIQLQGREHVSMLLILSHTVLRTDNLHFPDEFLDFRCRQTRISTRTCLEFPHDSAMIFCTIPHRRIYGTCHNKVSNARSCRTPVPVDIVSTPVAKVRPFSKVPNQYQKVRIVWYVHEVIDMLLLSFEC